MEQPTGFHGEPVTDRLDAALTEAAADHGPDTIVLMRVLMEAPSEAEARMRLTAAASAADPTRAARLQKLLALWDCQPQAWTTVRSVIDGIAHHHRADSPDATLRYLAESFDRLATVSPEGSVALYSLGSPELLAAATDEVVEHMTAWGLLGLDRDGLDLGCGIGRFLVALAPKLRSVKGLDISARMVAEATDRCRTYPNIEVAQSTGRDLGLVASRSVDLVLAADVFPYLVQAGGGLPASHIAEFARVLRPGGAALILNYSYRVDPEADRNDVATAARDCGFVCVFLGAREFAQWDASAFLLRLQDCG